MALGMLIPTLPTSGEHGNLADFPCDGPQVDVSVYQAKERLFMVGAGHDT
jgi:hypothetical protein